jgi:hypothetical protein
MLKAKSEVTAAIPDRVYGTLKGYSGKIRLCEEWVRSVLSGPPILLS